MPHNSIPGHGEYHETPAAGTPTAIAAEHAGTTPDAYAAQHGQAEAQRLYPTVPASGRPSLEGRGSSPAGASGAKTGVLSSRGPWYQDDRVGLAISGLVVAGVLVVAWYLHRNDED